ncbi:hypothetical protein [Pseudoalteromonas sp. MMG012]|uniref:hypothetical protein n=1 Tax=Pseudoalteromonas sp. MMG012 TaxID=2822686 RepID=UPI001B3A52DE|nr:hypothetical protein [Pseudoalteromonas sp. MMG012]MBQ4849976.1 hypothetical protein [Pseudoalteromonas sp. MMG012]
MQKLFNTKVVVCLLCCLCLQANAALTTDIKYRMNIQDLTATGQDIFVASNTTSLFSALDISTEYEGLRVAATASWLKVGGQRDTDVQVSEAFYDFTIENWFMSAGKKKVDWDVGYGFRPLDMFSPTDSLAIYTAIPPGAIMVTGDYFLESGNVTLICNESSPDYLERGVKVNKSTGCGGRYYGYFEGFEAQVLGHYDEDLGMRVGGSALTVIGENLELHGSLLWQENYRTPALYNIHIGQNDRISGVNTQWKNNSIQALLGVNYSFQSGITVIAEYWHDGRAPSDRQWRDVINLSQSTSDQHQLQMLRSHFATQSLFQDNAMVHIRTSSTQWSPSLTLLTNPNDNSVLIDGELCYGGVTASQLCMGIRQYTGGAETIYEQLSYERTWYFTMEINL